MADNVVRMPSDRWIDQLVESGYLDPPTAAPPLQSRQRPIEMRAHSRLLQVEPDDDGPKVA